MEGWVASRVSISTVAVGSHCGAVGLGQHFGALAESNTASTMCWPTFLKACKHLCLFDPVLCLFLFLSFPLFLSMGMVHPYRPGCVFFGHWPILYSAF